MAKSKTKRRHVIAKYRSGLEKVTAEFLVDKQKEVRYEKLKVEYEDLRHRTYTPDFVLDNGIIVETKGLFSSDDRMKHLLVKKQHPSLDIRFVFWDAHKALYKGSKTRYSDWCEKHGFKWAHKVIPEVWLTETGSEPLKGSINLPQRTRSLYE